MEPKQAMLPKGGKSMGPDPDAVRRKRRGLRKNRGEKVQSKHGPGDLALPRQV